MEFDSGSCNLIMLYYIHLVSPDPCNIAEKYEPKTGKRQ
jgi:hypothetical protein